MTFCTYLGGPAVIDNCFRVLLDAVLVLKTNGSVLTFVLIISNFSRPNCQGKAGLATKGGRRNLANETLGSTDHKQEGQPHTVTI